MMSIGTFAGIGAVSVRMLRHWDAVGLLRPDHVDSWSGYRSYSAAQLSRLHRIVALRELGFGLDDVRAILADGTAEEQLAVLSGLLATRRKRVEAEHAVAVARLADVERRLREITEETTVPETEIVLKPLPALRLAARRAHFDDGTPVGDVVENLFVAVADAIGHRPGALDTPIAQYTFGEDGLDVVAGYAFAGEPDERFEVIELPAAERAACTLHLGEMARVRTTWATLMTGVEQRSLRPDGPGRELYVQAEPDDDQSGWVTELQLPVSALPQTAS